MWILFKKWVNQWAAEKYQMEVRDESNYALWKPSRLADLKQKIEWLSPVVPNGKASHLFGSSDPSSIENIPKWNIFTTLFWRILEWRRLTCYWNLLFTTTEENNCSNWLTSMFNRFHFDDGWSKDVGVSQPPVFWSATLNQKRDAGLTQQPNPNWNWKISSIWSVFKASCSADRIVFCDLWSPLSPYQIKVKWLPRLIINRIIF